MSERVTPETIQEDLARVERMVARVLAEGFDEDVVSMAREELAGLRLAARELLEPGPEKLDALATSNHELWRRYSDQLKKAHGFLEPLS